MLYLCRVVRTSSFLSALLCQEERLVLLSMELDMDEMLIESVKNYSVLWDPRCKIYRDRQKKEQAWLAVLQSMKNSWPELEVEGLKKNWKKLRDYYVKEKKRLDSRTRSGAPGGAGAIVSSWALFPLMDFLQETVTHRQSVSNFSATSSTSSKSSSASSTPSSRARAHDQVLAGVPDEDGEYSGDDSFFEQQID